MCMYILGTGHYINITLELMLIRRVTIISQLLTVIVLACRTARTIPSQIQNLKLYTKS